MANTAETTERHQHKAPQCQSSDVGTICKEEACKHDHHISTHVEVSCAPAKGQSDLFDCVHTHS